MKPYERRMKKIRKLGQKITLELSKCEEEWEILGNVVGVIKYISQTGLDICKELMEEKINELDRKGTDREGKKQKIR